MIGVLVSCLSAMDKMSMPEMTLKFVFRVLGLGEHFCIGGLVSCLIVLQVGYNVDRSCSK